MTCKRVIFMPSSTQKPLSPHTLSATLLVAGTCIGGAMLALPVACAKTGFWPSIITMAITWFMMTMTALCLVEVGLWVKTEDAHIVSLSKKFLGTFGRWISWILFLFISYASLVAYTSGSGKLLTHAISSLSQGSLGLSHDQGCFLFIALFGPFIFVSHYVLGKANSILFYCMLLAYLIIIGIGATHINTSYFIHTCWSEAPTAVPLLLTSFSFHTMVPSLHPYLHHDKRSLRISIVAGTFIAFLFYFLWQFVVLGSVPLEGSFGLLDALEHSETAIYSLVYSTKSHTLMIASGIFAFLSLVTSFFGISLGLYDFLRDGLQIKRGPKERIILGALVLIPSLFFAVKFDGVFFTALDLSGGFGDTILNGLIPIIMVWTGWKTFRSTRLKKRWKSGLLILAFSYLIIFGIELIARFNYGDTPYDNRATDVILEVETSR